MLLLWTLVLGYFSAQDGYVGISGSNTQFIQYGVEANGEWYKMQCKKLIVETFGAVPTLEVFETCLDKFLWCDWLMNKELTKLVESFAEA